MQLPQLMPDHPANSTGCGTVYAAAASTLHIEAIGITAGGASLFAIPGERILLVSRTGLLPTATRRAYKSTVKTMTVPTALRTANSSLGKSRIATRERPTG